MTLCFKDRALSCITESVVMLCLHTNALDWSGHCDPTQGNTNIWPSLIHFYPASLYHFWQEDPMRYKVLSLPPTGLGKRNRRTVIVTSELRETRLLSTLLPSPCLPTIPRCSLSPLTFWWLAGPRKSHPPWRWPQPLPAPPSEHISELSVASVHLC